MRLDALLKLASEQSHEAMHAGGGLGSRIVLIDAQPRPIGDLREALARANFARWRQVGSEWILDSGATQVAAWEKSVRSEALQRIRDAQARLAESIQDPVPPSETAKRLDEIDKGFAGDEVVDPSRYSVAVRPVISHSPIQVALDRVVVKLDPEILLDSPQAVFTSHPNRLQHDLPSNAAAEVASFEKAQAAWSGVVTASEPIGHVRRSQSDPRSMTAPPPPGGLRLFLRTTTNPNSTLIRGFFVDSAGRVRYSTTQQLFSRAAPKTLSGEALDNTVPIDVPDELVKFPEIFWQRLNEGRPAPAPPEIRSRLLAPDRFEPVDVYGGGCARLLAHAQKKDLVAWLPDSAFRSFAFPQTAKTTTAARLQRVLQSMGTEIEIRDGWMTMRPRELRPNLDRAALATLLRAADRGGYVPFDSLVNFAGGGNYNSPAQMVDPILECIVPRSTFLLGRIDPNALNLFASLPQSQRTRLTEGGSLEWSRLPKSAQGSIEKMVLSSRSLMVEGGRSTGYGLTINTDPTELLGGKAATSISLTGHSSDEESLLALGGWNENYRLDAEANHLYLLAKTLVDQRDGSEQRRTNSSPTSIDRFVPGRLRDLQLTVNLAPGITLPSRLMVGEFDARLPGVPLEGVPADLRKRLEVLMDEAAKRYGSPLSR